MIENPLSYIVLFLLALIVAVAGIHHYINEYPAQKRTKDVVINSMCVNLSWDDTKKNKKRY